MFAKTSWICLFLAAGLFIWGSLCMVWPGDSRQDEDALIVEGREHNLGEQTPGTHNLELRVSNISNHPRRIIGMGGQ